MKELDRTVLSEIRDLLKVAVNGQAELIKSVNEMRTEQKKLQEEIKISNFVLNNISMRSEINN